MVILHRPRAGWFWPVTDDLLRAGQHAKGDANHPRSLLLGEVDPLRTFDRRPNSLIEDQIAGNLRDGFTPGKACFSDL